MLRRIRDLFCAELRCERLALNEASYTASGTLPLRNPRLIPGLADPLTIKPVLPRSAAKG